MGFWPVIPDYGISIFIIILHQVYLILVNFGYVFCTLLNNSKKMKQKLVVLFALALLAIGFSACTTVKNGCNASSGMVGYH